MKKNDIAVLVKNIMAAAAISTALTSCYVNPGFHYFKNRPAAAAKQGIPQNDGRQVTVIPSEARAGYAKRCYQDTRGTRICECYDRRSGQFEWCTLMGGNND